MPKALFVDFKAVKAALSMEQVLNHYDLLHQFKKSGDSLSGPCPIHKGENPTQFRVSVSKNVWHCFSECKRGGNVLDFISLMENVTVHAAALKAIEWFHLNTESIAGDRKQTESAEETTSDSPAAGRADPKANPEPEEQSVPNKPLKFRLDKLQREHAYLTERGLTLQTIIDFGAGYCSKGMMAGRIAIPIYNLEGEAVAYAGRFIGDPPEGTPKYKLPQGFRKSQELFNIDRASKQPEEQPLVIVEGFFGCMALHQLGHRKVVALMGSSMSPAQEEIIKRITDSHSHIIVMLDEDEAGQACRADIAVRLSRFCYVRVHQFERPDMQPEHLSEDDLHFICRGAA